LTESPKQRRFLSPKFYSANRLRHFSQADRQLKFEEVKVNSQTGKIKRFSNAQSVPLGWLELTEKQARELLTLPLDLRVKRYMEWHRTDKCRTCGCFIGNHSLHRFKVCAAPELDRLDTPRLEEILRSEAPAEEPAEKTEPQAPRRQTHGDAIKLSRGRLRAGPPRSSSRPRF
jgi:hypothetical protein